MEHANADVQLIYTKALGNVESQITWYTRSAKLNGRLSKTVRLFEILLVGAGIISPLIDSLGLVGIPDGLFSKLGYVFFGAAGVFLLFDRFYGLSTGWMRFMTTKLRLERMKKELEATWMQELTVKAQSAQGTDHIALAGTLIKFITDVDTEVQKETETWVQEFQTNLSALEQLINKDQN
jgi:hypothetical protein